MRLMMALVKSVVEVLPVCQPICRLFKALRPFDLAAGGARGEGDQYGNLPPRSAVLCLPSFTTSYTELAMRLA